MTKLDDVRLAVQPYFNHLSSPNYVRILDTPHVWGLPFGDEIMPYARKRQEEFERAIVEVVQKAKYRCDIASLNCPDPSWGRAILGAIDTTLSRKLGRTRPTQFRFLFGQTPLYPFTEPPNYSEFKAALIRFMRIRSKYWERMPEIWMGRFYRLRDGVLSSLKSKVFGDSIVDGDDTTMTWNHSKIISVDGAEALVGGHNLNMDLFRSYPPVHDVSVVVHGEAALGAQLFLNRMWETGKDLLTKEYLEVGKLAWFKADDVRGKPVDPLSDQACLDYMADRRRKLIELHAAASQKGAASPAPAGETRASTQDIRSQDLQTLADLGAEVFPERIIYNEYDKLSEYKLANRMLSIGKYWKGANQKNDYQNASEYMKEYLIKGAKRIIRMSQMDLVSAWKKSWSDHMVCRWLIEALIANENLSVQVVVSPLDAGAGAEGDQYSFGSGAVRTFELIKYYMTHDIATDKPLSDADGARADALARIQVAPLYYTDQVKMELTGEGTTYKWPRLSPEGYTATLKQPPLSEKPPSKGIIGSAAMSSINASGYIYKRVPSAPGNHAKIMIVDDELYVVGSDNLYPGFLSEFNYLVEGKEAVNALLESYWTPLWRYAGPHACKATAPARKPLTRLTLVTAAASSTTGRDYNGKPTTAERLLENQDATFWNSDDTGKDRSPWIWVMLSTPSIVQKLRIKWKSSFSVIGARAMKYRVLGSLDGVNWTATGRSQADVVNLHPSLDQDSLPGWPGLTRFIRIEMSESSYREGYFTCHGLEVWGMPT